ncbi:MAG: diphthamide synthesis protein [Nanoarchaeota archaeon]|nr:diphthamide synthesis protein [Nanoarchaeota archaeon]
MKTLFIPVKSKVEINSKKVLEISSKLPKEIAIAYSVQYKEIAEQIKKTLSDKHEITKITQVLGCSKPLFPKQTKAILIITDGEFHATSLAFETKLPVYILNSNKFERISTKSVEVLEKKQKASYINYLNSEQIGILVSTKPGQQKLNRAIDFKKNLKNKKSYLFISNNLNSDEFENFGLKCFVNTACPRMDIEDSRIINLNTLNTLK